MPTLFVATVLMARVALAACPSSATVDWLKKNETAGGHVRTCHVGIAANGLIGRITGRGGQQGANCKSGESASSFTDDSTAASAIDTVLRSETKAINEWWAAGAANNLALDGAADSNVGTVITRYEGKPDKNRSACPGNTRFVCKSSRQYKVVLKKKGEACIVLTGYPQ